MNGELRETAKAIRELWPSWGTDEQVRQLHRLCKGWTDIELLPLARLLADEGKVRSAADVARALRRRAFEHFGGAGGNAPKEMTSDQELCHQHRLKWGSEYANYPDDEMLALIEKSFCQMEWKTYGKVRPHIAYDTKRYTKSCTGCHGGLMTYGGHDVDRQGMSGEDYRQQNRYWLCECCGATEARNGTGGDKAEPGNAGRIGGGSAPTG